MNFRFGQYQLYARFGRWGFTPTFKSFTDPSGSGWVLLLPFGVFLWFPVLLFPKIYAGLVLRK
jgi:hypothetical protein